MSNEKTITRTCLPTTPVAEIHVGDIVVYQSGRMQAEREGRVLSVGKSTLDVEHNGDRRQLHESMDYFRLATAIELAVAGQKPDLWAVLVPEINTQIETGLSVREAREKVAARHKCDVPESSYYAHRKRLGLVPFAADEVEQAAPAPVQGVKLPPDPEKVAEAFQTVKRLQEEKAELERNGALVMERIETAKQEAATLMERVEELKGTNADQHRRLEAAAVKIGDRDLEIAELEASKDELATELAACTRDMETARNEVKARLGSTEGNTIPELVGILIDIIQEQAAKRNDDAKEREVLRTERDKWHEAAIENGKAADANEEEGKALREELEAMKAAQVKEERVLIRREDDPTFQHGVLHLGTVKGRLCMMANRGFVIEVVHKPFVAGVEVG